MGTMMEVKISRIEYDLIREALETEYYHSKDDGDKNRMKRLVKLEESLIKQASNYE